MKISTFIFLMVLILVALGFLSYQLIDDRASIAALETELDDTRSALVQTESELDNTEKALDNKKAELDDKQAELEQTVSEYDETVEKLEVELGTKNETIVTLRGQVKNAMCKDSIEKSTLSGITTNQGLIDLLTKNIEESYGTVSISTTFDLVWNNSKTAIFRIMNNNNESYDLVVSWYFDKSQIKAIYDINSGCIMYVP